MSNRQDTDAWSFRVSAKVRIPPARCSDGMAVSTMFGLEGGVVENLYDDFELSVAPGRIIAVVGPSGAGKSVFLREAYKAHPCARRLRVAELSRDSRPAVAVLEGGTLERRLALLSRCGLADAHALVRPARNLSGGQLYRLALAEALHRAGRTRRPALVVADEFAATLDDRTAQMLCRQMRKLISRSSGLAMLLASPRPALLEHLQPDVVIVKPLGEPARIVERGVCGTGVPPMPHTDFRIEPGTIRDYHALAKFHYLAGPPAAHKRVYVIRAGGQEKRTPRMSRIKTNGTKGEKLFNYSDSCHSGCYSCHSWYFDPPIAAVLVVSPPVPNVRGRNLAFGGRYSGKDRHAARARLNREMECISRVVVHPVYRGCGLAVRLVRHALASRRTRNMESLAAMGALHPMFELAGMRAVRLPQDRHLARLVSAAQSVGISAQRLAAVDPVHKRLAKRGAASRFLQREIDLCIRRTTDPKRLRRQTDPLATVCRRTARQYVYYFSNRS